MGFFSWDCKGCGRAALSRHAVKDAEPFAWMTQVIVLDANGGRIIGEYDGYGRVESAGRTTELMDGPEPCLYHYDCWCACQQPGYDGPSERSRDQGWFFDNAEYTPVPSPSETPVAFRKWREAGGHTHAARRALIVALEQQAAEETEE
jgi:hypothetical protein